MVNKILIGPTLTELKFQQREEKIITQFKVFIIVANATKGFKSI